MMDSIEAMMEAYRRERERLAFLDSNLWIGRPRVPEFASGFDLDALCRHLRRYGIRGGVVSHFAAPAYSPEWANARLLEALAGRAADQAAPLWAGITLLPEMFVPEQRGRADLAQAISRGARLARLFPRSHNFSLRGWCSGALLQALTDHRLPLVLWHTEASWEDIRALCATYPELPVIVEGTPQKILYHDRLFYPLLEAHPNLHLELHNLAAYLAVEDLARRFGAQRLIYGSYMPVYDPNAAMMQVTHARLSDEDKACIAHRNLAGLLAQVRVP